ncbi:GTP cyclohydrolase II [Halobacillus litoralis]|uniref:GTP cyclohydrolase II n=1 Tax=Halobacillus litoralis TaxID=45668 RepID=A0A410MJ25_9BACI|nr:GTP cyclohydrolase II [Halobacillus litoralis]QAS54734.1 GTP cyclohydrolase [Halobacillus litoralis]
MKNINSKLQEKVKTITINADKSIFLVGPISLPLKVREEVKLFNWYSWISTTDIPDTETLLNSLTTLNFNEFQQSSILVYGDFENSDKSIVRLHSICHTGDIFGSQKCECGFQLKKSLETITEYGSGALFYLANHEGRGIGLFNKALTYLLQEDGMDTVEANNAIGFDDDLRDYEEPAHLLKYFRRKPIDVISNNPSKINFLTKMGIDVANQITLWDKLSSYNERYIETKINKSGHVRATNDSDLNIVGGIYNA